MIFIYDPQSNHWVDTYQGQILSETTSISICFRPVVGVAVAAILYSWVPMREEAEGEANVGVKERGEKGRYLVFAVGTLVL